MVAVSLAARGLRIGPYELLARIAAGGMGEVFIARRTGLGNFEKRVALKLLLPHLSEEPELVARFLEEARIAARMNHPHIVQLFDVGEAEGRYYLAMALVEGVSLSQLLRACRRGGVLLPLPVVRLIATGLCEGLHFAHHLRGPAGEDFRVIHRDVSPSNVMLSTSGAVLLNDFGIAKALSGAPTRSGKVWGKYAYMPPEQLDAREPLDARADVFAAAVTLHHALTLASPFQRETDRETMEAIRHEALPEVTRWRRDVSPRVQAALRGGAERDRERRLPSARALLEAFIDGPVASPAELGALVESLCEAELAVFRRPPPGTGDSPTHSLLPETKVERGHVEPRPRTGRRALAVGGGVATLVAALGAWHFSRWPEERPPSPTQSPAPPSHRPVEAPEPAPAPAVEPQAVVPPAERTPERSPPRETKRAAVGKAVRQAGPKAPEAGGIGYLTVDARPWAVVSVDGHEVDQTPLARYPLPAGKHTILFRNPVLAREETREVLIEPGGVSLLRVDFNPPR